MKSFFASKINWAGILLMLVGLQEFILQQDFNAMTAKDWVTFGIGGLIVVLRTWFTSTNIQ